MKTKGNGDIREKVMKSAREDDLVALTTSIGAAVDSEKLELMALGMKHAASFGAADSISWLVANGASVDGDGTSERGTPLFYAASNGHVNSVGFLLDRGAAIDKTSFEGMTPLMGAASQDGHTDVVALLLKRGANPNAHDEQGNTALMHVSEGSYRTPASPGVARLLLAGGADYQLRNLAGQSAKDIAVHAGVLDVASVIDEYDANVLKQALERSVSKGNPAPERVRLSNDGPDRRQREDLGAPDPKPVKPGRMRL